MTRRVLRRAGPGAGLSKDTVGGIAIHVLQHLRPFLTTWHTKLSDWERQRDGGTWPEHAEFRANLATLWPDLRKYTELLAIVAGVGDQI